MSRPSHSRRLLAAVLGALVAVAGLGLVAPTPASATAAFDFERLFGVKRWDTAVEVAKDAFPQGSDTVVLANGVSLADALVANFLAGGLDAPILLSLASDIPDATVQGLRDLGVTKAYLVGGTAVLGQAVVDELADLDIEMVDQIGGTDRFDSAQRLASAGAEQRPVGEYNGDRTAFVTTGRSGSTDALVAGPLAYSEAFPILLSTPVALGNDASAALQSLQIEHVVIIGGTAAVSDSIRAEIEDLAITTERIAGADRFETAQRLGDFAIENFEYRTDHVNLATGIALPDAIAGGPHGGREKAPIILGAGAVPTATCAFLTANAGTLSTGHIFGGVNAISIADELSLEECGGAAPTNQTFNVAPSDADNLVVDETREYTVTNLGETASVDLALIPCTAISASGQVFTFLDTADPADRADGFAAEGAPAATITRVNGVDGDAGDLVNDATVVDGVVAFTVTASANGCATPVVWADGDSDNLLNLDADDRPTEEFGVGGAINAFAIGGVTTAVQNTTRPFRASTSVTGQLTDGGTPPKANPAPGQTIGFIVESTPAGFDGGACSTRDFSVSRTAVTSGTATTNLSGLATFSYDGPADPDAATGSKVFHCITTYVDANANGAADEGELAGNLVQVTFTDAAPKATTTRLTHDGRTRPAATNAVVTVKVLDQYGDPMADQKPQVELFRNGSTTPQFRRTDLTTDSAGSVAVVYGGPNGSADDIVVACIENPNDATEENTSADNSSCDVVGGDGTADLPSAQLSIFFVVEPDTLVSTGENSCVLAASANAQFVDVDNSTNSNNLRLRFDGDDQFRIISNQGPIPSDVAVLQSTFAQALSPGDRIQVEYAPSGVSTYRLVNDTNCTFNAPGEISTNGGFS